MAILSQGSGNNTTKNGGNSAPSQEQLNANVAAQEAAKQAKTDAIKQLAAQSGNGTLADAVNAASKITNNINTGTNAKVTTGTSSYGADKGLPSTVSEQYISGTTAPEKLTNIKTYIDSLKTDTPSASTPSTTDYYSQLLNLFQSQNEQARQNQLDAIMKNLDAVKSSYKNRIQNVIDEYDALVDQNEVAKYKARKSLRENQANRGQLDSGMGRQEQLQMNLNYDNNANSIKTAKQNAINEIYNLITQAEAEAESNKANVNNTYANALLQYQLAQQ